jgi:hypothetical protein
MQSVRFSSRFFASNSISITSHTKNTTPHTPLTTQHNISHQFIVASVDSRKRKLENMTEKEKQDLLEKLSMKKLLEPYVSR